MAKVLEGLAESLPTWGAKMAYGEKTTLNGQDFVPAALVVFGFGGGEGSGESEGQGEFPAGHGEGSGGGGGGYAIPVGAYIGGPNGLKFHPNPVAMIALAVPLVTAVGWAASAMVRLTRVRRRFR
ncbi:hypothetical protein [Agromyces sp. NPDC057865]|jgi:uncharacterized spore protein YtfJ|uniref:hypothetical protein n=1 Tax=Agromyces sp. NPDC057865 TaxID=3346267 RepID=UPI00366A78D7